MDRKEREEGLSSVDNEKRDGMRVDLAKRLHMEEACRQKARENWPKDGNRNTKYFHCLAKHRRCNYVEELYIEDSGIKENEAI